MQFLEDTLMAAKAFVAITQQWACIGHQDMIPVNTCHRPRELEIKQSLLQPAQLQALLLVVSGKLQALLVVLFIRQNAGGWGPWCNPVISYDDMNGMQAHTSKIKDCC